MKFCSNCGTRLGEKANFCHICSAPVSKERPQPNFNNNRRQEEYAGNILKCPACGLSVPSFTAICPGCGHEINSIKVSSSYQEFIEKVDQYDRIIAQVIYTGWASWGNTKRFLWIILNIYTFGIAHLIYSKRSKKNNTYRTEIADRAEIAERNKILTIENYVFSNNRETILEMLIYISSKLKQLKSERSLKYAEKWNKIWANKAEDFYTKAELLFPGDKIANDAYREINIISKELNRKILTSKIIVAATIILVILISLIFGERPSDSVASVTSLIYSRFL